MNKERVRETLSNGNTIDYWRLENGTCYHWDTPEDVVAILEKSRETGERIRLFLGDTKTGRDWACENDTMGHVGRSTGRIKIPLLIKNSRSTGGGGILDNCIVKITSCAGGMFLWQHEKYNLAPYSILDADDELRKSGYAASVFQAGENVANFKSGEEARHWVDFMWGRRNTKNPKIRRA